MLEETFSFEQLCCNQHAKGEVSTYALETTNRMADIEMYGIG